MLICDVRNDAPLIMLEATMYIVLTAMGTSMSDRTVNNVHHQNSEQLARPLKVAYFEKQLFIDVGKSMT